MASNYMVVSALGRQFALGKLYDTRNDKITGNVRRKPKYSENLITYSFHFPTDTVLWDHKTITDKTVESSQTSSDFKMTTSDTLEEKSSLLDVEASMKASFLGGLIEVGGSAKYLNNKKKSQNQNRLTLQYKATTTFKHLSMSPIEAKNMQVVDDVLKGSATHVVTGILYGANAFFVFDSDRSESDNKQDIQGKIEAMIKKIPSVSVGGQASLKLSDTEKSLANNLSCQFYGDFILESNPTTFEEAVKTYQQLPKLLREGEGKSVPMKVWLMPLKDLDSKAAELKREICIGLIRKAENALEDVREMEMRCNHSLEDNVVGKFSQVSEKMSSFKQRCNDYASELQKTMNEKFPSIRAGEADESSVEKLFDDRDKSPFSQDRLNEWMSDKEREINVIKSCVGIMENIPIVANKSELDAKAPASGVEHALCFTFTSLGRAEPYLDELSNYLHSHDRKSTKIVTQTSQDQWYSSDEVITEMRKKAETFNSLFKALKSSRVSFLIAAVENEKYKGASIYHYKKGIPVTDNFSQPARLDVENITDKSNLIWYACDLTLDPNTAYGYLTLSEGNKKATLGGWQQYPSHPERFDTRPQVLCREGLTGRCYWEVKLSEGKDYEVGVGVTYKGIARIGKNPDSGLGCNTISWYFGKERGCFCAWNDGKVWTDSIPAAGFERVGVYLDWRAGTLSFYRVCPNINTVSHLYTFRTTFTESVYPGFYIYSSHGYAALCPVV
ncbi:neoverrucotoxin subunit beta-like [Thunnus maccoyii]|uniref:neoverrucotoxin subunit beta-like n=1 Tax=Thunnus maccoyii TaxID=8240 RepID=UPI001C4C4B13|nr:neoverrucotoxin subunit beta-like [Thunnus maccoyii]